MTNKTNSQAQCGKCKVKITKSQGSILCDHCNHWIHISCSGIDDIDLKVIQKLKSKWICEECKSRTEREIRKSLEISSQSTSQLSNTEQNDNGEKIMKSIRELRLELTREIRDLKASLTFYSEQYEEQKIKNETFAEEIRQLKKQNEEMNQELKRLKDQNEIKDQQARTNNVVVVGIHSTIEEQKSNPLEIKRKIEKVMDHISPSIKTADYDVRVVNPIKENSPILVSFQTKQQKMDLMTKRREKGIILSNRCGLGGSHSIYINEDLSKDIRELLRSARRLRHNNGYKFVWVKSGSVFVRRDDNSDVIKVKCVEDVEALLSAGN